MRTGKLFSLLLAFFLCITCFGIGNAGILSEAVTISPFLGNYHFEGNQDLEDEMTFGLGIGYNFNKTWGMEVVGNLVNTETEPGGTDIDVRLFRLDGLYHLTTGEHFVPYIGAGIGGFDFAPDTWKGDAAMLVDYGGGVKYFFNDTIGLRADVRHIVSLNDRYNNLMYTIGLVFQIGEKKKSVATLSPEPAVEKAGDRDHDGVADDMDQCPDTPHGVAVDNTGCPLDSDQDGVPDGLDQCPDTAAGVSVDRNGCPLDSDQDGVADDLDKCPDTMAGAPVDAVGCPLDSDQDGVADYLDKCPGTSAGVPVDQNGCPSDTDTDGVADYLDQCANTPVGAAVDSRGCWVIQGVQFVSGKSDIMPEFYPILDRVTTVLNTVPGLKVEIQGYTDSKGPLKLNQRLSDARAKRIMQYFVDKGIDVQNLSAKGFGPSNPIATNDTPEGRAQNRRVELKPVQ